MKYSPIKPIYLVVCSIAVVGFSVVQAKTAALAELERAGFYGRVHAWQNKPASAHKLALTMPKDAPIIVSDYHSKVGANGLRRKLRHNGVDIFQEIGTPIIAAADGKVVKAKNDKCWGPTVLISHGRTAEGKPLYALYGHMRNIKVVPGQRVKRGQQIAEMGEDIMTGCGAGFHHLHFQISRVPYKIPFGWGWANFVTDGEEAPNPHQFWADGPGKITCFREGEQYQPSALTYPLPCRNSEQSDSPTTLVQLWSEGEAEPQ